MVGGSGDTETLAGVPAGAELAVGPAKAPGIAPGAAGNWPVGNGAVPAPASVVEASAVGGGVSAAYWLADGGWPPTGASMSVAPLGSEVGSIGSAPPA